MTRCAPVIAVLSAKASDFISLTDTAKFKNSDHADDVIRNWLRNRNTVEFPGVWERLNNPDFKPVEFDGIRIQTGLNSFTLTPKQWIEKTGAIGITSQAGRYGGTYAHKDIAFEFASWVSVEFKLYLLKEFQRLNQTAIRQMQTLTSSSALLGQPESPKAKSPAGTAGLG